MTTKLAGGKITGILALTMEASEALVVGDPVHVDDDYSVAKADGTKPILGNVSVANVKREANSGRYPVSNVPGDVTVEARGFSVRRMTSGAAVTVGGFVGIDATQRAVDVLPDAVNVVGIALMGAGAADVDIDVLVR